MRSRLSLHRNAFGPGPFRPAFWLVFLSFLCALGGLRADIQEPTHARGAGAREQRRPQPASGVAQTETIDQGGTVEITLHSSGQIGKWVNFMIRSEPAHGSLTGPPIQLSRTTAEVTYVHHAADGPGTDSFTYSVQAAGTPVSAAVPVTIEIRDTAPQVVARPAELDFGAVRVGDTSGADLVLENQGGGEAVGRLELPAPWRVEGSPEYRLARGERQSFHILFGPRSGRSYSEAIPLLTDSGAQTHLLGTGLGPPGEPGEANSLVSAGAAFSGGAAPAGGDAGGSAGSARGAALAGTGGGAGATGTAGAAAGSRNAAAAAPKAAAPWLAGSKQGAGTTDPMRGMTGQADDTATGQVPSVPLDNSGFITLYDSGVKQIKLRGATRTALDISWKPLKPAPKLYRIELRYLAIDQNDKLRIDWRPYAQVEIHTGKDLCTATVRGLPPQVRQTLRVVAIDFAGGVAGASATLQASTLPPSTFWRVTPLRVLVALLLLCLGLALRRRWEIRQMLREIDESRAARAASPDYLYRS